MKKIIFIILCIISTYCRSDIGIYDLPTYDPNTDYYVYFIKPYPHTIWSYLFIDRELKFKIQLDPKYLLGVVDNYTIPINYWSFKVSINF